ncbi:acylneuraminate cytidylyltransferase family protein [bacterium]|nr:acylneuraminate cytidylyltransferase family protein [bacterium]
MSKNRFLGIIPARSGSKGVKLKNIRPISGKPLINYTIEAALRSELLNEFVVSTDSEKIRQIALSAGAKVPFLRPKELAEDHSTTIEVVWHVLDWYKEHEQKEFDYFVILQPTTPLRESSDIDNCIKMIGQDSLSNSLISCCDATHVHPTTMYIKQMNHLSLYDKSAKMMRRQDFEPVYLRNGAVYITRVDYFKKENRFVDENPLGYIMPRDRSVNIDEEFDLKVVELLLKQ